MIRNKIFKRVLAIAFTLLVLVCLTVPCFASDTLVEGSYPYVQFGTFGNLITSSPVVELEVFCTLIVTQSNNPSGNQLPVTCIFSQRFTDYYFKDWLSNFANDESTVYDFWRWCLNDTRTLWASSGRSLTFNEWVTAYSNYRSIIYDNFIRTYSSIDDTVYYNTAFQAGKEVGYSLALSDRDVFKDGLLSIFDAPFYIIHRIFNFDLFGINIYSIVMTFITVAFIGFVIKLVM